jgi:hypothetical protein
MLLELWGFFELFKSFFPIVVNSLGRVPVIGPYIATPAVRSAAEKLAAKNRTRPPV